MLACTSTDHMSRPSEPPLSEFTSKKPLTRVSKRVPGPTERGAWRGAGRKVGKGLAKGWRRVGERLAKGWRSVGKGLAGFLAPSNFVIPRTPV